MITLSRERVFIRQAQLPTILNPLTLRTPRLSVKPSWHKVFVYLGGPTDDPTNALVRCKVEGTLINYHERWIETERRDEYYFERAYLHLYRGEKRGETVEQILALHCDPAIDPGSLRSEYKRGPHLHISDKRNIFSRAHIGLCLQHLEDTIKNEKNLTESLGVAIKMIAEEFLILL